MKDSDQNRTEDTIDRLRKALDAETEARIEIRKRLERAEEEIGEFVSLAVHNLREPLRDIASLSQLMAETYAGRLDPDAAMFLGRIQTGAANMQALLADVVDYWAAGDQQDSRTDMEAVLRHALLSADKQITERGAIVTHDPLPLTYGDSEVLTKVLRHLITNAIEYCDEPVPRVHISAKRVEFNWVFSVTDNGPGIEAEFQDRIFGIFKRLHGKERPGNGLGLAFCKKAIKWHGGRMWVDSTPGAGSTFYFTLQPAD
jgi:light-regulated signal transduction histidine kinase (bacteriophytochrome)